MSQTRDGLTRLHAILGCGRFEHRSDARRSALAAVANDLVARSFERSPLEVAWHEVVRDSRQRTAPRVAAVLKAPASKYRMWPRQPVASLTHIV